MVFIIFLVVTLFLEPFHPLYAPATANPQGNVGSRRQANQSPKKSGVRPMNFGPGLFRRLPADSDGMRRFALRPSIGRLRLFSKNHPARFCINGHRGKARQQTIAD